MTAFEQRSAYPRPNFLPNENSVCREDAIRALLAVLLGMGIHMVLTSAFVTQGLAHLTYSERVALGIALVEFFSSMLNLQPRVSISGALFLTGYLTTIMIGHEPAADLAISPLLWGMLMWAGLFL